jgi:hypothetical protein
MVGYNSVDLGDELGDASTHDILPVSNSACGARSGRKPLRSCAPLILNSSPTSQFRQVDCRALHAGFPQKQFASVSVLPDALDVPKEEDRLTGRYEPGPQLHVEIVTALG